MKFTKEDFEPVLNQVVINTDYFVTDQVLDQIRWGTTTVISSKIISQITVRIRNRIRDHIFTESN